MRLAALVFALWVAASMIGRVLVGRACAPYEADAWDACALGVLDRHGLADLLVPWFVGGLLALVALLVGLVRWLRSPELWFFAE